MRLAGIFYFSLTRHPGAQSIALPNGINGYVRVRQVTSSTLSDALSYAMPRGDEHVLSTQWIDREQVV